MKPLAKITRPSSDGIFLRNRLFSRLDRACLKPVIFINGPPGSGKTSLITSYIEACELPCLWYQVDVRDRDIASFFYYMGIAVKHLTPHRRKPLPLLTSEYLMGIKAFTLRFFEDLYSRLSPSTTALIKRGKGRFVIVFDNYQEVQDEPSFQEMIVEGLSAIPKGIHVFIISRSEPPQAFAQMLASQLMEIIGWNELKFNLTEARRLFQHKRFHRKLLEEIYMKTEGWAAGLVLLAEQAKSEGAETLFQGDHTQKEIFNYFANVIFQKTEPETKEFLKKTSFFRRFTADMAKELTRNQEASRILSDLNKRNYFIQRRVSESDVYEYHNLFREFLLKQVYGTFHPHKLSQILHHAARLCEDQEQSEDAIELFLEARAWDDAALLILKHAPTLVAQGRGKTVSGWIETLPESMVQHYPYLLYWKGICYLPYSPSMAREDLEKVFRLFEEGKDPVGVYLAWCGVVNTFLIEWDDFKPLDFWIEWLDKFLSDGSNLPPPEIYPQVAVSMMSALTYRRPWYPNIDKWLDRALSLTENHPDLNLRIQATLCISTYYYFMGEHVKGVLLTKDSLKIVRSSRVTPSSILAMKFLGIILHWLISAPGSASHLISESLATAEKTGVHGYDLMLYSYGACDFLARGDLQGAERMLKKMESAIRDNQRCALGHYHAVEAWYYLLKNDLSNAAAHAEKAVQFSQQFGMPFGECLSRIMMVYVLQGKGESDRAHEQIEIARNIGRQTGSSMIEWLCSLADAWIAFKAGQETVGLDSLKKAMNIGRIKGLMNFEGWLPSVMADLCLKALEKGIEVEYVRDLIRMHGLIPDVPPYDCEEWPWPLRIYTLGQFQILKNNKPVQYPVRAPRAPLTLLKTMISFGRNGVKEDRLVDTLWPEADGDTAHQTFRTTLHRLRQLIGDEKAIQVREGWVILDQHYCWVDAYAFEILIEKAEPLLTENQKLKDSSIEPLKLIEKALALYKGTFLGEGAIESWVITYQERLRSKFIRAIRSLGNHFERNCQWEKAVECYKKGLEVDELAEEFYQRLMTSYLSWGRRAEALAIYKRCQKILKSTLGIEPSPKTEEIFKSLREKAKE